MCKELNIYFHSSYHPNKKSIAKKRSGKYSSTLSPQPSRMTSGLSLSQAIPSTIQKQFRRRKNIFLNCLMGHCKEAKSFPSHKLHYKFHSKALFLFQYSLSFLVIIFMHFLFLQAQWVASLHEFMKTVTNA